jgi:hypothetical protein
MLAEMSLFTGCPNHQVLSQDSGLSLGQAAVAAARMREEGDLGSNLG